MAFMRSTVAYGLFWINLLASIFILIFWIQDAYEPYILSIDIVAILFVILLMISFCLNHNECCTSDPATNESFAIGSCYGVCICCGDCNCSECSGNSCDCEIGLLILVIFILVFVAIYYAVRACGKHISRIFSVFVLMILDLAMAVMSIMTSSDKYYILIAVFSIIAAICNFLGLLLPNLASCKYLSFSVYIPPNNVNNNNQNNNTPSAQPFIQPAAPTYPPNIVQVPPQQQMVPIYNQPGQTYNNGSGNIYDTSSNWYNPQNYYGNVPPPANEQYPKPNNK